MRSKNRFHLITMFVFFSVFLVAVTPGTAQATPPKNVQLTYDPGSMTLTVAIKHYSLMPGFHYIKNISIKKNGQVVSSGVYKNQPAKEFFNYEYQIPASAGDNLEVTAMCSFYGSKMVEMKFK